MEDRCIFCDKVIPEGRDICSDCYEKLENYQAEPTEGNTTDKKGDIPVIILGAVAVLVLIIYSWIGVCAIGKIVTLLAGITFSWSVCTWVWLALSFVLFIFGLFYSKGNNHG